MEIDNLPDGETPDILPGRDARSQRAQEILASLRRFGAAHFRGILACGILGIAAYAIATHLPFQTIERGDAGLRVNQWTGDNRYFQAGSVLVIPGIHELHTLPLRDRVYQPKREGTEGFSFQSIEGLTVAVDFSVRYALDPGKMATTLRTLPDDIDGEIVLPAIQGALHKTFPRYTVREIFSERRQEIEEKITKELETRLAKDGIKLKSLAIGKIDLPPDYLAGMEKMLEAELQTERMRFTLELKEKQVKESELTAEADKVRREKAAEAAAQEQVIAAQAQSEAMKHILPFKEKQIKQRELEAEAAKVARLMDAQAQAEARLIEATAEADSRKKLADAEAYRLEQVSKINSDQMAREGAILAQSPLLVQKTLAEKLSDKVQVIIVPPGTDGRFVGENLIGRVEAPNPSNPPVQVAHTQSGEEEEEE